jgi:L,D-peptidoglycan transpeptidase YkuD (ErfK/YbiS/YcfS/YnhG family)
MATGQALDEVGHLAFHMRPGRLLAAAVALVAALALLSGGTAPAAASTAPAVRQIITVSAKSYGSTYATLTAYRWTGRAWVRALGPWTARIGADGMARPHAKIEGDDLTPQGTYGFSFMFGVLPKPSGVTFSWYHAYSYDVWDDDPASARYNLWTDKRHAWPGRNPEPMHNVPAYDYAAVIAYNTARTPGLGSAIFLHVGTGSATGGCVSLPTAQLLSVLRWLRPADSPRITMAVGRVAP